MKNHEDMLHAMSELERQEMKRFGGGKTYGNGSVMDEAWSLNVWSGTKMAGKQLLCWLDCLIFCLNNSPSCCMQKEKSNCWPDAQLRAWLVDSLRDLSTLRHRCPFTALTQQPSRCTRLWLSLPRRSKLERLFCRANCCQKNSATSAVGGKPADECFSSMERAW